MVQSVVGVGGRSVTCPEDLVGLRVEVVAANEEELTLRLPDGRVVRVWASYDCLYSDCSGADDPWPLLEVKEVGG